MSEAKPKIRLNKNAATKVGLALLVAVGSDYAIVRNDLVPPGSSEAQIVRDVAVDFFELQQYESRLERAQPAYMNIQCAGNLGDALEEEARIRGITDPRRVELFKERVFILNGFTPAIPEFRSSDPFTSYGFLSATATDMVISDTPQREIVDQHIVDVEVMKYENGVWGYSVGGDPSPIVRNLPGKLAAQTTCQYRIKIPNVICDDSPADIVYQTGLDYREAKKLESWMIAHGNDIEYQHWFEVHPEVEPPHRLRKASVPSDSYADSTRAHANHFAGRKK